MTHKPAVTFSRPNFPLSNHGQLSTMVETAASTLANYKDKVINMSVRVECEMYANLEKLKSDLQETAQAKWRIMFKTALAPDRYSYVSNRVKYMKPISY